MSDWMKELERLVDAHEIAISRRLNGAAWNEETDASRAALLAHAGDYDEQKRQADFYSRRCNALQKWQSRMRDPERTVVCDILANGNTLPSEIAGSRYAAQPQKAESVTCVQCGHENWVMYGKASAQITTADKLAAAPSAPAQADRDALRWTWQPIETAPTDGTRILLRGKDGKIADGHYGQPDGYANPKQFVWPYINANPTHWRPLPAQHESAAPVELPEPDTHCYDTDEERDVWSHSPDQMRTYGDAREAAGYARGVAEERERCAAICDRMGNPLNVKYEGGGCRKAAAAIRAAQKGGE